MSKAAESAIVLVEWASAEDTLSGLIGTLLIYPTVRAAQLERLAAETDEASIHLGRVTGLL